jgi:formate hydrogenlyase transcriptional activator
VLYEEAQSVQKGFMATCCAGKVKSLPAPADSFSPDGPCSQTEEPDACRQIIGKSPAIRAAINKVRLVAPTDAAVLIQGQTGTGKELIAQAIHDLSERRFGPFVKVNCAAIPGEMLESELFGHERGAFTDAVMRTPGRFQSANKGTLLLDEVGELPLHLQPKLLRVLQERELERLGSSRPVQVDVRVVAATNQDLAAMVTQHRFRADLYYRLNAFPIDAPPLRERTGDVPLLVHHFVQHYAQRFGKPIDHIPDELMERLQRYSWPGNIRELQNLIERAVVLSAGSTLQLRFEVPPPAAAEPTKSGRNTRRTLADAQRDHILEVLRRTKGMVGGENGAAKRLGMPRSTLIFRMLKLGIPHRKSQSYSPSRPSALLEFPSRAFQAEN